MSNNMDDPKPKNFGKLNPEQIKTLEYAIRRLKADGPALLHDLAAGKAVLEFTAPEKPGTPIEQRDEDLIVSMRKGAVARESVEQAEVRAFQDASKRNIKIEIETPFGFLEHPSQAGEVKHNFLVAHVSEVGELQDVPRVEVRNPTTTLARKR
jgi:hypothetical protein